MPKIGLLFDSISKNTGDEAIGIALQQQLHKYSGTKAEILNPFEYNESDFDAVIIGGGQLIRQEGDSYYDNFRLKGKHILNTAGLLEPVDKLEYLQDYSYVSVRTQREAEIVKKYRADVECHPCVTTLLSHKGHEYDIGKQKGEKIVGIHLVPYTLELCPNLIDIINSIKYKKVFIPYTHYNLDKHFMESLPLDFSNSVVLPELLPEQLHSVIGQLDYAIVSSLHASIYAYTQNVPFATLGQQKVVDYFTDRGLEDLVFSNDYQMESAIKSMLEWPMDFSDRIENEKLEVKHYLDKYFEIAENNANSLGRQKMTKKIHSANEGTSKSLNLQLEIAQHTMKGRDRLIGQEVSKNLQLKQENKVLFNDRGALIVELIKSIEVADSLKQSKTFRLGSLLAHPLRLPKGLSELIYRRINSARKQRLSDKDIVYCKNVYQGMHQEISKYLPTNKKYAIILHLYYIDMWEYFKEKISLLNLEDFDIYVTVPVSNKSEARKIILSDYENAIVLGVPNRGRDVLPFLEVCKAISSIKYAAVLKIHSKKSTHREDGKDWLDGIVDSLIPTKKREQKRLFELFDNPQTAVVGPAEQYVYLAVNYEANKKHIRGIVLDLHGKDTVKLIDKKRFDYGFFAGTMFWFNPDFIKGLIRKSYDCENFEFEDGSIDSTFAHSLERILTISPEIEGASIYAVDERGVKAQPYNEAIIPEWSDVYKLIMHARDHQ
jgi:hypothetical protein